MKPAWLKPRGYKHFDAPVGEAFAAKAHKPAFIKAHSWSPLIHYVKSVRRYKPLLGKTVPKNRSIMYASHRDACILSKYSYELNVLLEKCYKEEGLDQAVIAYRALGKANYHFSADAAEFAKQLEPCVVLCFDITGFFDNLDHGILKARLKELLSVTELPEGWYQVYRHVTAFRKVERDALSAHPILKARIKAKNNEPIATIAEVKALGIEVSKNLNKHGIPQGTPISSSFSNLYMLHLDRFMVEACKNHGALYQRYSDDLIIICKPEGEAQLTTALFDCIADHKLTIHPDKCDRVVFDASNPKSFQYLGFDVSPEGAIIRPSSLSRQWRKLRRNLAKAKSKKHLLQKNGDPVLVHTKKLRRRFSPIGVRNFSLYARRAADSFGSGKIRRQVIRLEKAADEGIRALNKPPT